MEWQLRLLQWQLAIIAKSRFIKLQNYNVNLTSEKKLQWQLDIAEICLNNHGRAWFPGNPRGRAVIVYFLRIAHRSIVCLLWWLATTAPLGQHQGKNLRFSWYFSRNDLPQLWILNIHSFIRILMTLCFNLCQTIRIDRRNFRTILVIWWRSNERLCTPLAQRRFTAHYSVATPEFRRVHRTSHAMNTYAYITYSRFKPNFPKVKKFHSQLGNCKNFFFHVWLGCL